MEHGHCFGGFYDAAEVVGEADPILRYVEHAGEFLGDFSAAEELVGDGVFAAVVEDGEDVGVVVGAHVEMVGLEVDVVAHLGLGLLPEVVGLDDERVVMVLGIGCSDGAGLAVGGTTVVEEVELLQKKGFETPFGSFVGGGAAHNAGSDDDHVELNVAGGRLHLCLCV